MVQKTGVLIEDSQLFIEPAMGSEVLTTLAEGSLVTILDDEIKEDELSNKYYYIEYKNDVELYKGYIDISKIELNSEENYVEETEEDIPSEEENAVEDTRVNATKIEFEYESIELEIGEKTKLVTAVEPYGADIIWSSNDDNIATVEKGVITAISPGVTKIYATNVKNDIIRSCKIIVLEELDGIAMNNIYTKNIIRLASSSEIDRITSWNQREAWKNIVNRNTDGDSVNMSKEETEKYVKRISVPIRKWKDNNGSNPRTDTYKASVKITINKTLAPIWKAFYNDLYNEAPDFVISSMDGCYFYKKVRGSNSLSSHSYGASCDINSGTSGNGEYETPYSESVWKKKKNNRAKYQMIYKGSPMVKVAHRYTIVSGTDWTSPRDAMHFSYIGDVPRQAAKECKNKAICPRCKEKSGWSYKLSGNKCAYYKSATKHTKCPSRFTKKGNTCIKHVCYLGGKLTTTPQAGGSTTCICGKNKCVKQTVCVKKKKKKVCSKLYYPSGYKYTAKTLTSSLIVTYSCKKGKLDNNQCYLYEKIIYP